MRKLAEANDMDVLSDELRAVDWDFGSRGRPHALEGIHPYPAKFIPDIPATLLSVLPVPPDTVVLDPFCGGGTTMVEAQRIGLRSVGVDLNPIACLVARVKTGRRPKDLSEVGTRVADVARRIRRPKLPPIPNVDHWFKPSVQDALASLLQAIGDVGTKACDDALRLSLSSIIVRVSNQDSDTRYAAVGKDVGRAEVFGAFIAACERVDAALAQRTWKLPSARVVEADATRLTPQVIGARVGMVITSPPYPNAYEYWLYHKYRMWWLGFDPLAVKAREIGARAHFFKRDRHTATSFKDQMRPVLAAVDSVLVPSGFACIVIGRSKIHGRIVDNAATLRAIARERHMHEVVSIERLIAPHRKSFNLAHANIKTETVLVFQKGQGWSSAGTTTGTTRTRRTWRTVR